MDLLGTALKAAGPVAGIVAPIIAADKGIGKNTTNVTNFGDTSQYDPNASRYGRDPNAANATANRFAGLAQNAQNRQAAQANYGRANDYDARAFEARQAQGNVANLMYNRATGATPSIAQMQADRQMQQADASQQSAAAGARGAGGLALAGQAGAGNVANAQGAISGQAQINAAQERLQAEQAALGAFTGMRGGDQASQQIAGQQAQYNAGLQAAQRAQNDAFTNQMFGQEADVRRMDLTGGMNDQSLLGNTFTNAQSQKIGVGQANANREMEYYKQFMGGIQGTADAGTAMNLPKDAVPTGGQTAPGSPPPLQLTRARGGPVDGARPYLVGEQGPELIVPSHDGYVLTAPQTRDAIARAYGGLVHAGGYPARAMGGPVSAGGMSPLEALMGGGAYGGVGASAGAAPASYDVLNPDGSMNVQGSLQAHSDAATRYGRDPTGGMQGGGLMGGMGGY